MRRTLGVVAAATTLVIGLTGQSASAAGQNPDPERTWPRQFPAEVSCGIDGVGSWVRFVTNGSGFGQSVATASSKGWSANYVVATATGTPGYPRTLNVTGIKDSQGNSITFESIVVHLSEDYPKWTFARALESGLLNLPSNRNVTQLVICAYPPDVTLTVKKVIDWKGETPFDWRPRFQVNVTCVKAPGPSGANFATPGSLLLEDGQTGTVVAPAGTVCTASDADADFVTTPVTVTLPAPSATVPATATATVTNTRKRTLTITKQVSYPTGWSASETDPTTFEFTVECAGEQVEGSPFELGNDESASALVPDGQTCSVVETASDLYTSTSEPASTSAIVMNSTTSGKLVFTNSRKTGNVRVTKTTVGGDQTFEVKVDCGSAVFTLPIITSNGTGVAETPVIPTGTACTVSETATDGWTLTAAPTEPVVVAAGINEVALTNTRDTGSVGVTKTVDGGSGTFSFSVTCGNTVQTASITIDAPATSGSVEFSGLPTGACTVQEAAHPGGFDGAVEQAITVAKDKTTNVEFTNTRQIDLAISKLAPTAFVAGTTVNYSLGVSNIGPATAPSATVTDVLPAGLQFVSAAGPGWSCAAASAVVTCTTTASLAAGAAYPAITVQAKIVGPAGTPIINTATVTGEGVDPNLANNSSSATKTPTVATVVLPETLPKAGKSSDQLITAALSLLALGAGMLVLTMLPRRKGSAEQV